MSLRQFYKWSLILVGSLLLPLILGYETQTMKMITIAVIFLLAVPHISFAFISFLRTLKQKRSVSFLMCSFACFIGIYSIFFSEDKNAYFIGMLFAVCGAFIYILHNIFREKAIT